MTEPIPTGPIAGAAADPADQRGAGGADASPYELRPIGRVVSPLTDRGDAPRQADEGAPPARLVLDPQHRPGLRGLRAGQELVVLTWLHLARRDVVLVHPRGDEARPLSGVFATRAPTRPNPVGLHHVTIESVDDDGLTVDRLEAVDGTPVVDLKPVLGPVDDR